MAMNTYTTSSCGENLQNSLYKGLINKETGNATSNSIAASNQSRFIPKKVSALLLSLICVLTLAACGGGGGGSPPGDSPPEVKPPPSIGVSNLRVIPDDTSATLSWDNPAANIISINITYHNISTPDALQYFPLITGDDSIRSNAINVTEVITGLTNGATYIFNVLLELGGADESRSVMTTEIMRLIGPNLDEDEYADADPDELDEDGDGVDDEQDAFPRDKDLTAFAVSGLTADAGDGEVTLSWTNPNANISSISISYQRDDSVGSLMMNSSAQITPNAANVEETIDGLTNGQSYTFNVNLILTGDDADKEVEAQSVNATPILFTISVLNLRITPNTNNATLMWDNPDAYITQINISYKLSTDADFGTPITITDDAKIATNATDVMEMITSLTSNTDYTFRVALELGGADENVTTSAVQMTRLIGPNLDGDEYADADSRELDKDGDGVNDVQDAFPRDDALFAFTVSDLTARPGKGEVTLSWNNPDANIASINISYHNTSAPNTLQYFPLITNRSKTAMNAMDVQETIANLTNGVSYTFNVTLTLTGDDVRKEVEAQSVTATPILSSISVLNLRVIPDETTATLIWDNPDASITQINISYKLSTDADFGTPITITDDAKIATNATDVMEMITSLTSNTDYTFRVALELGGADENVTTSAVQMTRLIGPNLDGDEYADADSRELDKDGDNVNDVQDAFPDDRTLSAFTVTDLTAHPGDEEVTLSWDNPDADIANISISYKLSTAANFETPMTITDEDSILPNATVTKMITGLTNGQSYTFRVALELKGADENRSTAAIDITRLIGPNLDGDEYADADPLELDKDGDNVNDVQDAFPDDRTLSAFTVTDLTAHPGDEEVTLSWDNPDADIANISISYKLSTAANFETPMTITDEDSILPNATVTKMITGLTNGQSYTFRVALELKGADENRSTAAIDITRLIGPNLDGDEYADADPLELDKDGDNVNDVQDAFPDDRTLSAFTVTDLTAYPGDEEVTLSWDNPDADIANISISYKLSTAANFETPMTITDEDSILPNATVTKMITGLTNGQSYTFRVALELKGADENRSTAAIDITRLIGPNLDGDEYADADPLELDKDGDNVNDVQDAFPDDRTLSAFTVTDLTAHPGDEEVTLSWNNPIANISGISISYYNRNTPNDLQSHPLIEDSTQTTPGAQNVRESITGLTNGQSYTFIVNLTLDEDDAGKRVLAKPFTATPNLFTVTGLDAVAGDSNVTISWTNPDTDNIASINISYHKRSAPNDLQYFPLITNITKRERNMEVQQSITTGPTNEGYYTFIVALTLGAPDNGLEGEAPSIEVAIGPDYDDDGIVNFLDTDGNGNGRPNRDNDGDTIFDYLDPDDDNDLILDEADVDDDGDGLIEIVTAEQLNQTRHNLLGSNFTLSPASMGNKEGCGNGTIAGEDVIACNGYELSTDISLADYANWEPIGRCITYNDVDFFCEDASAAFNAIFDGNGWTISNLTITNPAGDYANGAGLFGVIAPTSILHNVHIRSANISGGNNVGLLVGYARGIDSSKTRINNSSVEGEVTASGYNVGGLVGRGDKTIITSSYAEVENVIGIANQVGGLVGHGDFAEITSSYASGNSVRGYSDVGGLVGSGTHAIITSSYSSVASVNGSGQEIGGLVGEALGTTITSSYAVGSVSGGNFVGGLVGDGQDVTITSSYAAVSVSGDRDLGGLVGVTNSGYINVASSRFYWDTNVSGVTITIGNQDLITAGRKTTGELQTPTNDVPGTIYARWVNNMCPDGSLAWDFGTAMQYPALTCPPKGLDAQRP